MKANPKIFKAYDIRGEWNTDWDSEFVYGIGKAIAAVLKPRTIAIGKDMRLSGEEIFNQLAKALTEEGINVLDLGLCATEQSYFAVYSRPEIDLSIMITASHCLGKDNGLKITSKKEGSLGLGNGLDKIRDYALSGKSRQRSYNKEGKVAEFDIWLEYQKHVFSLARLELSKLTVKKIVVDAGNGVGGYLFDRILGSALPLKTIKMYWEPDGNFPHHLADPFQEKNVEDLKEKVRAEKAELGIAYDGDSDRVFFVDETGRYLPGYYCTTLFSRYLIEQAENPEKETIVYDPRYYRATKEAILRQGAKALPSQVGHTLIKKKMKESQALFAGECSGHLIYRENHYSESSMLTTLLMLKMISEKGLLSKVVDPFFKKYPISGEINFLVENSREILLKLEQKYPDGKSDKLDGMEIQFPDWRFNVRSSNTQPLLRLNIEADNYPLLAEKVKELKEVIGGKLADY